MKDDRILLLTDCNVFTKSSAFDACLLHSTFWFFTFIVIKIIVIYRLSFNIMQRNVTKQNETRFFPLYTPVIMIFAQ